MSDYAWDSHHPSGGIWTRPIANSVEAKYHHLGKESDYDMPPRTTSAIEFLERAADLMRERGKEYDSESGERSMASTVKAFNAITGRDMTESEGWAFMLVLKLVRQSQKKGFHRDSAEDAIAYAGLMAESLAET